MPVCFIPIAKVGERQTYLAARFAVPPKTDKTDLNSVADNPKSGKPIFSFGVQIAVAI